MGGSDNGVDCHCISIIIRKLSQIHFYLSHLLPPGNLPFHRISSQWGYNCLQSIDLKVRSSISLHFDHIRELDCPKCPSSVPTTHALFCSLKPTNHLKSESLFIHEPPSFKNVICQTLYDMYVYDMLIENEKIICNHFELGTCF